MKDIISIIFAAMVLSFLLVILPLFSVLDRQDTMSYNLVLTKTTAFVDEVRANGFMTLDEYSEFVNSLASTGNTYKINIETYKTILVKTATDTYEEKKELYNSQDIIEFLEGVTVNQNVGDSNKKDNIYLLNENDEIYIRVYNTNTTSGSLMYNLFVAPKNNKVIDITYGGRVKEINWELYTKLKSENTYAPDIEISIPVNGEGKTNIKQLVAKETLAALDCSDDLVNLFSQPYEICANSVKGDTYKYIYDLDQEANQTIIFYIKINGANKLRVSDDKRISKGSWSSSSTLTATRVNYIKNNFIMLNGMTADVKIEYSKDNSSDFKITLTNVEMITNANVSTMASLVILPGLAEDANDIPTVAAESIAIQLTHKSGVKTTQILGPYNWKKFEKTKNSLDATLSDGNIYANEEVYFKIQYTGIRDSVVDVKEAIKEKIKFYQHTPTEVTYYTPEELRDATELEIETDTVLVKMKFPTVSNAVGYVNLDEGWYKSNMPEGKSEEYNILKDNGKPYAPTISLDGTIGNNGWYVSDVKIIVTPGNDTIDGTTVGGSGIMETKYTVNGGEYTSDEQLELTESREDYVIKAWSKDYVGNKSNDANQPLKIDKIAPNSPIIKVNGAAPSIDWYNTAVTISISDDGDHGSGVNKITYEVTGSETRAETQGNTLILDKSGIYTVKVNVYDNAGNKTTTSESIKIDLSEPPQVTYTVVEGTQKNGWYITNVLLKMETSSAEVIGSTTNYRIELNNVEPDAKFMCAYGEGKLADIEQVGANSYKIKVDISGVITEINNLTGDYEISVGNIFDVKLKDVIVNGSGKYNLVTNDSYIGTTHSKTLTIDGEYKIIAKAISDTGIEGEQAIYNIKIDKTAPNTPSTTITGTKKIIIEDASIGNINASCNLTTIVTDDNNSTIKAVSIDNNIIIEIIKRGSESSLKVTKEGSVVKNINNSTPDNQTEIRRYQETINDTWYNSNVNVTTVLNGDKGGSGEQPYSYEIKQVVINGTEEISNLIDSGSGKVTNSTITVTAEGANELNITVKDGADNSNTYSYAISIDKTPPEQPTVQQSGTKVLTIEGNTLEFNVTITKTDDKIFTIQGANTSESVENKVEFLITSTLVSEVQQFSMTVKKNETETSINDNSKIQQYIQQIENAWYKSDILLTMKLKPSSSGAQAYTYKVINNGTIIEESASELLVDSNLQLEEQGENVLTISLKDGAGNEANYEINLKVDKTMPSQSTINLSAADINVDGSTESGTPTLDVYLSSVEIEVIPGQDNLASKESGVNKTTYEINKGGEPFIIETILPAGNKITVSEGGSYSITVKTYDNAGNYSSIAKAFVIETAEPPDVIFTPSGTAGDNGWFRSAVELVIDIDNRTFDEDTQSNIIEIIEPDINPIGCVNKQCGDGASLSFTSEGEHTVKVQTSTWFTKEKIHEYTVKIDKTAPNNPSVTINGTSGENDWYLSDVTVTTVLNGDSGGSGEQPYSYEVKNNGTVIASGNDMTSNTTITITTEGTNTLRIIAKDGAGNERVYENTIKIDKTAPAIPSLTINGTSGENDWFISDVTVTPVLNGDNGGSGEQPYSYKVTNNGTVVASGNNMETNTAITVESEGTNIVKIIVKDGAGNETVKEETIKIDKTAPSEPTLTINGTSGENDWYLSDVTITTVLNGDNGGSGATTYSYEVTNNGTVVASGNNMETNTTITLTNEGINEINITVKDVAGNERIYNKQIKIDKGVPTMPTINLPEQIEHDMGPTMKVYNDDVSISITPGTDLVSGVSKTTYSVNKSGTVYVSETTGTEFSITESGTYQIIAKTYDEAGRSYTNSGMIMINKEPPEQLSVEAINGEASSSVEQNNTNIEIKVANFIGEYITVKINGPEGQQTLTATTSTISLTVNTLGTYTIQLTQTNEFLKESNPVSITYKYVNE